MKNIFDFAVIGGGASGLYALRGLKNKKTVIIEKNNNLGVKLLITGGSKCNFTNKNLNPDDFLCSNPHFIKSFLAKFNTSHALQFIKSHNIPYEERDNGKLFTLSGADKILKALIDDGKSHLHTFKQGYEVTDVEKTGDIFKIITDKENFFAKNVIVSSGGLSFPKLGATPIAYKIAKKFGMKTIDTYPALTSLKYPQEIAQDFSKLAGISLYAQITVGKKVIKDDLLLSHSAFSGPLALNASLYLDQQGEITINFAPKTDIKTFISQNRNSKKSLTTLLSYHMPKALVKTLLKNEEYNLSQIKKSEIEEIYKNISEFKVSIKKKDGYNKAEVTKGGVSVDDIFPNRMESRKCPGLFFIGEALDVTGILGGYNLHWAWASSDTLINFINKT